MAGKSEKHVTDATGPVTTLYVDDFTRNLFWVSGGVLSMSSFEGGSKQSWTLNVAATVLQSQVALISLLPGGDDTFLPHLVDTLSKQSTQDLLMQKNVHIIGNQVSAEYPPCVKIECSHLCVTSSAPTGAECLCEDMFDLDPNGRHCIAKTYFQRPSIFYSFGVRLCALPITHAILGINENLEAGCVYRDQRVEFRGLAFDYKDNGIHVTESKVYEPTIRKFNTISKGLYWNIRGHGNATGVAYDWRSNNVYWTDRELNHIRVVRSDGLYMTTLVAHMDNPRGIVVDAYNRYIYWLEGSPSFSLVRSEMDGSNITVITSGNMTSPEALTLDYGKNRLYWTDGVMVDSILTNGSDRRVIYTAPSTTTRVYGIAVFKNQLIVSEWRRNNGLTVLDKTTGDVVSEVSHGGYNAVYDVIAYEESNQPGDDVCVSAGCSQLCIQGRHGNHTCMCTDGQQLSWDGRTCIAAFQLTDNYILVASYYRRQVYQIPLPQLSAVSSMPSLSYDRPLSMTMVHPVTQTVIWGDIHYGTMITSNKDGSLYSRLWNYRARGSRLDGIAYDPTTQLVYYTDLFRNQLGVTTLTPGVNGTAILIRGLRRPRAIVLDPENSMMYFTYQSAISSAFMDGLGRTDIITTDVQDPSGIAIDFKEGQLYWCDRGNNRVETSDMNGNNRRQLIQLDTDSDLFSLVLDETFMYLTDWRKMGIGRALKQNGSQLRWFLGDTLLQGEDLVLVNSTYQEERKQVSNPCDPNNGDCEHFCLPRPGGYTCVCKDGYFSTGKTCVISTTTTAIPSTTIAGNKGNSSQNVDSGFLGTGDGGLAGTYDVDLTPCCDEDTTPDSDDNSTFNNGDFNLTFHGESKEGWNDDRFNARSIGAIIGGVLGLALCIILLVIIHKKCIVNDNCCVAPKAQIARARSGSRVSPARLYEVSERLPPDGAVAAEAGEVDNTMDGYGGWVIPPGDMTLPFLPIDGEDSLENSFSSRKSIVQFNQQDMDMNIAGPAESQKDYRMSLVPQVKAHKWDAET